MTDTPTTDVDDHGELLDELYDAVMTGQTKKSISFTELGLKQNLEPNTLLFEALIPALEEVGNLFETGEYFVPEMLISARAMQAAMDILRPLIADTDALHLGTFVMGTVAGDIHDIGKNLCNIMLEGAGFEVVDLGVNVSAEAFVEAIHEHGPDAVGMSAFLTTTMGRFLPNITAIEEAGLRNDALIYVGGAPVTQEFADHCGADGYAANANALVRDLKSRLGVSR